MAVRRLERCSSWAVTRPAVTALDHWKITAAVHSSTIELDHHRHATPAASTLELHMPSQNTSRSTHDSSRTCAQATVPSEYVYKNEEIV